MRFFVTAQQKMRRPLRRSYCNNFLAVFWKNPSPVRDFSRTPKKKKRRPLRRSYCIKKNMDSTLMGLVLKYIYPPSLGRSPPRTLSCSLDPPGGGFRGGPISGPGAPGGPKTSNPGPGECPRTGLIWWVEFLPLFLDPRNSEFLWFSGILEIIGFHDFLDFRVSA